MLAIRGGPVALDRLGELILNGFTGLSFWLA